MPAARFVEQLNAQIGNELAAHNQYLACAVYYDALTMPQMAAFFYGQALEEREHALMMVQYLLDTDAGSSSRASRPHARRSTTWSRRSSWRWPRRSRVTEQVNGAAARSPARRTTSPPSSSCSGSSRSRSRRSRR